MKIESIDTQLGKTTVVVPVDAEFIAGRRFNSGIKLFYTTRGAIDIEERTIRTASTGHDLGASFFDDFKYLDHFTIEPLDYFIYVQR